MIKHVMATVWSHTCKRVRYRSNQRDHSTRTSLIKLCMERIDWVNGIAISEKVSKKGANRSVEGSLHDVKR